MTGEREGSPRERKVSSPEISQAGDGKVRGASFQVGTRGREDGSPEMGDIAGKRRQSERKGFRGASFQIGRRG